NHLPGPKDTRESRRPVHPSKDLTGLGEPTHYSYLPLQKGQNEWLLDRLYSKTTSSVNRQATIVTNGAAPISNLNGSSRYMLGVFWTLPSKQDGTRRSGTAHLVSPTSYMTNSGSPYTCPTGGPHGAGAT